MPGSTAKELAQLIEDAIVRLNLLPLDPAPAPRFQAQAHLAAFVQQLLEEIDRDLYRSKELWKVGPSSPLKLATPHSSSLARSLLAVAVSLAVRPSPKQHGLLLNPFDATSLIPRKASTRCT